MEAVVRAWDQGGRRALTGRQTGLCGLAGPTLPGRRSGIGWGRTIVLALGLVGLVSAPALVRAHDSPEHVVEMLTARMEVVGPRADLLWRRATEYRSLNRLKEAERDLRAALKVQSVYPAASIDLARVQLARGSHRGALRTLRVAMSREPESAPRPEYLMMQAEVLGASGRDAEAVTACDRAIAMNPVSQAEWYLARCHHLYRLGRFREAAAGLREGVDRTGNAVLEAEWLDAMLDAGESESVLGRVESELALSRSQAAWWIRRGRAWLGQGRVAEAHADFLAAITELNGRLGGRRLDFLLLAERGQAYALLGDAVLARADLAKARELGADDWAVGRLERLVVAAEAEAKAAAKSGSGSGGRSGRDHPPVRAR